MTQASLVFDAPVTPESRKLTAPAFHGSTYDAALDGARLATLIGRTRVAMSDGRWHTLAELARACHGSEASISARLRDFRKVAHGSLTVDRRRRGDPKRGIFEYRIGGGVQ